MGKKKIGEVFLTGLFLPSAPPEESVFIAVDECDESNEYRMTHAAHGRAVLQRFR